ncbi:MAG: 1-(5-phosphoribosyl)-5-[(5-phosphoribosylamino)methylideneamino]imidazole-4-carboxamide isomerase [Kofleriaceae bacterium]|nr:1-(5-phosphoribosyl)-5-[(5-phosphoribosylamino)methylideneamino]imidazole-4-carboxamide isomerase [Kofleriaceae bacterium]
MKLYPAIDLLGGKAVRLEEGRRDRATVFHDDPPQLVAELARDGADRLHVVDLDGAFAGSPQQLELVRKIVAASPLPVEVGGGIRDRAAIDTVLSLGASFVVLGTAAVRSPALVEEACRAYPGRVIVAVDARDGVVAVDGWTASGDVTAIELGRRAAAWGAAALLYTDVSRDGLHVGPNVEVTAQLARSVDCEVIASGGVGSLDDLARLREAGIAAVVVGRAIYDKRFTVAEAARVCHGDS